MTKLRPDAAEGRFARFYTEYPCQNKVQHWQLRDLVAYDADTRRVYTVCGGTVNSFCPKTKKIKDLLAKHLRHTKVAPSATTLAVQGGYVATGTDKGELSVYEVQRSGAGDGGDVTPLFHGVITCKDEVLNHLSIVPGRGGPAQLYAAGNDRTVRCYALGNPGLKHLDTIEHQVAVNYSAEDPSGQRLVTLGDDNKVHVHLRDSTGCFRSRDDFQGDYSEGHEACGMCCAWQPWGHCFATAFQSGQVTIWDVRSHTAVARQKANQAVRTVKFSNDRVDLLAYAEHNQAFHIVDARRYDTRQTVQACSQNQGISGITFCPEGTGLYVGIDGRGVQDYRVDVASRCGFSQAAIA